MFLFTSLQKLLNLYLKEEEQEIIARAYLLAIENMLPLSPRDLIENLMAITCILSQVKVDKDVMIAFFLKHTISKTNFFRHTIEHKYGAGVANIMREMHQLDSIKMMSMSPMTFVKVMLTMVQDKRALLIKLAEKIYSVRMIEELPHGQQLVLAQEALHIWVPLAQQLGITEYRRGLEMLAFSVLYPYRYAILKDAMHQYTEKHKTAFQNIMKMIFKQVRHVVQNADDIIGRKKSIYSVYQKMRKKNIPFLDITDLYAYKIIVKDKAECYLVLGLIHELFKPLHRKLKDYIGLPKSNGYQALHTILSGPYGVTLEVQIKTYEMDHQAEYGCENHYIYKTQHDVITGQASTQEAQNISQTMTALKDNFESDIPLEPLPAPAIYVYTPQEDIKEMPVNSSCLDFAFAMHTDLGNACTSAIVNNRRQPLGYKLKNGDMVKIITADMPQVNEKWLALVTTKKAKKCIQAALKNGAIPLHQRDATVPQLVKTIFAITEEHLPFLARCCKPLKGDKVIVTASQPLEIHRCGCKQIAGKEQCCYDIVWATNGQTTFKSALYLQLKKAQKATTDIMQLFTAHAIPIVNFNPTVSEHLLTIEVCIAIPEVTMLNLFMNYLKQSSQCLHISRYPLQE